MNKICHKYVVPLCHIMVQNNTFFCQNDDMLLVHLIICFSYVQHVLELISFCIIKNSYKLCKLVKRFTRITYVNLLSLRCKVTNSGQISSTQQCLTFHEQVKRCTELYHMQKYSIQQVFILSCQNEDSTFKIITLNHLMCQKALSINQLKTNTIKFDKCDK